MKLNTLLITVTIFTFATQLRAQQPLSHLNIKNWQEVKYYLPGSSEDLKTIMSITLPKVRMGNARLDDFTNYLVNASINRAPSKNGISLIIKKDITKPISIDLELNNVKIDDLLVAVCDQTGLSLSVGKDSITIGQKEKLTSRTYEVPQGFFEAMGVNENLKDFLIKNGLTFPNGATAVSYKNNYLVLNNTYANSRKLETVLNSLNIYKNKNTKKIRLFTLHEMALLEKLKADQQKELQGRYNEDFFKPRKKVNETQEELEARDKALREKHK
jgi:hypothetical protein